MGDVHACQGDGELSGVGLEIGAEVTVTVAVDAGLRWPWVETADLLRKSPNMYADISAVHYRPWRYWQAMVTAMEYGVTHKLLLASDFPSATLDNVIAGLRNVNSIVEGTRLPTIPAEIQDRIISENWKSAFPEWASAGHSHG